MDTEETNDTQENSTTETISKGERQRQAKEKAIRAAKIKSAIPWLVFIGVLVGGLYWLITASEKSNQNRPGEEIAIQGNNHLSSGERFDAYNSNPPTSGPHAGPVPWGFNEEEILDENVIHNLEHGGIWISYKDLDEQSIELLREIARKNGLSVVVSPREANDSPIALASWGRLQKFDTVDVDTINEYIRKNKNKSPERLAR